MKTKYAKFYKAIKAMCILTNRHYLHNDNWGYLHCRDNTLTMHTCDPVVDIVLRFSVSGALTAKDKDEYAVKVNLRSLLKYLKGEQSGDIQLAVRDDELHIGYANLIKSMPVFKAPIADCTIMSIGKFVGKWDAKNFVDTADYVLQAVGEYPIQLDDMHLIGTDNVRLHMGTLPSAIDRLLILPPVAITTLKRIATSGSIRLFLSKEQLRFDLGSWQIITKMIWNTAPAYTDFALPYYPTQVEVNAETLVNKLKHVPGYADYPVVLSMEFDDNIRAYTDEDALAYCNTTIECKRKAGKGTVKLELDGRYLKEIVSNASGPVTLGIKDAKTPIRVDTSKDKMALLSLCM